MASSTPAVDLLVVVFPCHHPPCSVPNPLIKAILYANSLIWQFKTVKGLSGTSLAPPEHGSGTAIAAREIPTTTPNYSGRITETAPHVKPGTSSSARDPKRARTLGVGTNSPPKENIYENTQLHTVFCRHLKLKARGGTKEESTNTADNLLSPETTTMPTVATRRDTRAVAVMTS